MDRALLPVVRASRLSRSLWLAPTLLVMLLSCSFAAYVAGYFDAYDLVRRPRAPAEPYASAEPVTVINVAAGVTEFFPLLGLRPLEHVTAINDSPVSSHPIVSGSRCGYLTVTTTQRRIVVLFH